MTFMTSVWTSLLLTRCWKRLQTSCIQSMSLETTGWKIYHLGICCHCYWYTVCICMLSEFHLTVSSCNALSTMVHCQNGTANPTSHLIGCILLGFHCSLCELMIFGQHLHLRNNATGTRVICWMMALTVTISESGWYDNKNDYVCFIALQDFMNVGAGKVKLQLTEKWNVFRTEKLNAWALCNFDVRML